MKGEVVFYRLFDIGASVDLDEIQKTIDMPFLSGRFPSERAAPRYARFAQPLLVFLDERGLATNLGPLTASIGVKLYGVGALAIVVRVPFEAAVLRDLRPFAGLRILVDSRERDLNESCGGLPQPIERALMTVRLNAHHTKIRPDA